MTTMIEGRKVLILLKGSYLHLGHWAATRPEIIPEAS